MKTVQHQIRRTASGECENQVYARITLPAVPGVELSWDRDETKPRQRIILSEKQAPRGAALIAAAKRRTEMFRRALIEVAQEEME